MNIDNESRELSYYRLTLFAFLKESHPEKINDKTFISVRAEIASQAYSDAIDNGFAIPLAIEMANEALFEGLHFSKHDTLINIIWNEFSDDVPQGDAKAFAEKILPICEKVFEKYPLSDDFSYSPEYERLYTELTGTVQIYIEEHVI